MLNAKEKIEQATSWMMMAHPWWASIYFNLRIMENNDIPTMATDGSRLLYNAQFTCGLSRNELVGVLMHEVGHCVFRHPARRGDRNPMVWNIACDAVINGILEADGVILPPNCVPGEKNMSLTAEDIYDDLMKNAKKVKMPKGGAGMDLQDPSSGKNPNDKPIGDTEWKEILASSRGLAPESMRRHLDDLTAPKINWREELSIYIQERISSPDRSWKRLSRRIASLPGKDRIESGSVMIAIDTSGSIDNATINKFLAITKDICDLNGIRVTVVTADAQITQIVEPEQTIPRVFLGGGGTSFIPAIREAEIRAVDALVYLTDGMGDFPASTPVPCIWAMTTSTQPPFGKTLSIRE